MSISSIATAAIAGQQSQVAQAMQFAVVRAGQEQEKALGDMLAAAAKDIARSSPPEGLGTRLDISV